MTKDTENSIVRGTKNLFADLGYAGAETHLDGRIEFQWTKGLRDTSVFGLKLEQLDDLF